MPFGQATNCTFSNMLVVVVVKDELHVHNNKETLKENVQFIMYRQKGRRNRTTPYLNFFPPKLSNPLVANGGDQGHWNSTPKKVVHIPAGLAFNIDGDVNGSATPALLTPTSTEMSWDGKGVSQRMERFHGNTRINSF